MHAIDQLGHRNSRTSEGHFLTLTHLNCTFASMTSLVRRRISRHKWKALPKRDFLRSLVVSVFTGFRLKL
eukprot:1160813-Pelagomonas_calceolata.AAC.14